jgi:hypothetical protein
MAHTKDKKRRFIASLAEFFGMIAGSVQAIRAPAARTVSGEERMPENADVTFEESDVSATGVIAAGASLLIGLWIIVFLLYFYFHFLAVHRAKVSPPPLAVAAHGYYPLPPAPRLQPLPRHDLQEFRAYEAFVLNNYAWGDKRKGSVRIPIERAMEILAQRGIPPQNAPASLQLFEPRAGTRMTGFEGKVEPEPR